MNKHTRLINSEILTIPFGMRFQLKFCLESQKELWQHLPDRNPNNYEEQDPTRKSDKTQKMKKNVRLSVHVVIIYWNFSMRQVRQNFFPS